LAERLWRAEPVRLGAQYRNRPARHGLYFWPRTREHVRYESTRQLAGLVGLDYGGRAAQVGFRPVRLLFRRGSAAPFADPDFLAVHTGGDQVLYDIPPVDPGDAARDRLAETARVCAQIGWRHEILSPPVGLRAANLEFLRAARLPRFHPAGEMFVDLRAVFAGGRPIGDGAAAVRRRHQAPVMPFVRHLLWHCRLATDLDRLLDVDTVVTTAGEGPCCG